MFDFHYKEDEIIKQRDPSFVSTKSYSSAGSSSSTTTSSLVREYSSSHSEHSYSQCFASPHNDKNDLNNTKNEASFVPVRYRGFSSSLSHLFHDETVVCTSLSCFGILLSLRTEHILNIRNDRMHSKSRTKKRSMIMLLGFLVMISFILLTYVFWGRESLVVYNLEQQQKQQDNEHVRHLTKMQCWHYYYTTLFSLWTNTPNYWKALSSSIQQSTQHNMQRSLSSNSLYLHNSIRLFFLLLFLIFLTTVGRRRRMRTRYRILQARAQDDLQLWISNWRVRKLLVNKVVDDEGTCTHLVCGCTNVDINTTHNDQNEDFLQCWFRLFSKLCCGTICKCWIMCCSICALAQEAREVKNLLPSRFQQVDYLTHESFLSYHTRMMKLRSLISTDSNEKISIMSHFQSLSYLTQYILIVFFLLIITVIATLELNPHQRSFGWMNILVLCATFIVSFVLLFVTHWLFHKSDLSLDAVIKFYAAGFLITAPTVMILETLLVACILLIFYACYGIVLVLNFNSIIEFWNNHYFILWIIAELGYCYFIAAFLEEVCKYFTFRSVEHPDLIFLTDLLTRSLDVEFAWDRKYRVGKRKRKKHFEFPDKEQEDEEEEEEYPSDSRNVRQMAAAITVAMVSVAVGLACAENFIYVFFIAGFSSVQEKFALLFIRSILPIHALCAALQSIHVIRRFIVYPNHPKYIQLQRNSADKSSEQKKIGVGNIILSSMLVHGTYDAILYLLNVYAMYYTMNILTIIISWMFVLGFFFVALCYYYKQNRYLRQELIHIVMCETNRKLCIELNQMKQPQNDSFSDDDDDDDDGIDHHYKIQKLHQTLSEDVADNETFLSIDSPDIGPGSISSYQKQQSIVGKKHEHVDEVKSNFIVLDETSIASTTKEEARQDILKQQYQSQLEQMQSQKKQPQEEEEEEECNDDESKKSKSSRISLKIKIPKKSKKSKLLDEQKLEEGQDLKDIESEQHPSMFKSFFSTLMKKKSISNNEQRQIGDYKSPTYRDDKDGVWI